MSSPYLSVIPAGSFIAKYLFWGIMLISSGYPSDLKAQSFDLRTSEAGLDIKLPVGQGTNGVAVADYNQDGILDVYLVITKAYSPGNQGTWNWLFSGNKDGTFEKSTVQNRIAGGGQAIQASYMGQKTGASWGDFNNDGFPDLFLSHAGHDLLLKNTGGGTFEDITVQAGVYGKESQFSSGGLWFDYDTDGDLDLFVTVWEDYADTLRSLQNRMYENIGSGHFEDVTSVSGLADNNKTWMAVALDVNLDGYPDLYLANDFGKNTLYLNNGDKTFIDQTLSFGLNDWTEEKENGMEGMGMAIGDADNNGFFDIFLTNNTEKPGDPHQLNNLFLNTGNNHFQDRAVQLGVQHSGWGWGTSFVDIENDGDEDLFAVNGYFEQKFRNRFYLNHLSPDSLFFEETGKAFGLADSGDSRAVVAFDYNNDGRQDLLVSNFSKSPYLYRNNMETGNWLSVWLEGVETNRDGLGSVIEIEAGGKVYRRYHHGAHFYGQSILPLHFGVGEATSIEQVTVFWLNGHVDEIEEVSINQTIHIKEKTGLITGNEDEIASVQNVFRLIGNYPNPFNNSTRIQFETGSHGEVLLEIFNILGQIVYSKRTTFPHGGKHMLTWQIDSQHPIQSGVYFFRLSSQGEKSLIGKMLYLK